MQQKACRRQRTSDVAINMAVAVCYNTSYKASADCIYTLHCFKFHKGHTLHYTTALRAVLRPLSQRHCNRVLCSYTTSFRPHSFAPAPLPLASYRIDHDNNTLSSCVTPDSVIVHCQLIIIHSRLKPAIYYITMLYYYSSHSNCIAL